MKENSRDRQEHYNENYIQINYDCFKKNPGGIQKYYKGIPD